jgi:hypothetical protein
LLIPAAVLEKSRYARATHSLRPGVNDPENEKAIRNRR